MNILDKTQKPDNFDTIPNPLYASWIYHWLKFKGADVSQVTPKWCYKEFIEYYPEYFKDFLEIADKTENIQPDLDKQLIKGGFLDILGDIDFE